MNMKITRLHRFNEGSCEAVMDVLFEEVGLTVNGIRMMKTREGKLFASFPNEKYEKDGVTRYKNIVAMPDKDQYFDFQHEIKHLYHAYGSEPLPPKQEPAQPQKQENNYNDDLPF